MNSNKKRMQKRLAELQRRAKSKGVDQSEKLVRSVNSRDKSRMAQKDGGK